MYMCNLCTCTNVISNIMMRVMYKTSGGLYNKVVVSYCFKINAKLDTHVLYKVHNDKVASYYFPDCYVFNIELTTVYLT